MESDNTFLIFMAILMLFSIVMFIKTSRQQQQNKNKKMKIIRENNAQTFIELPYLVGLSILENTMCLICESEDKYIINANGVAFNLNKEKIIDISLKTSKEIQNQVVSSIGGAIGGAMLFGPLGAIIGGRAKVKSMKTINTCLVFTYEDNNEIKVIAFNCTEKYFEAKKFVDKQTKNIKGKMQINL